MRNARADTWPGLYYPGCGFGGREYGQAILSRHALSTIWELQTLLGDDQHLARITTLLGL